MTHGPHELEFVLAVPDSAVRQLPAVDLHLPEGADRASPVVVVVPGPVPDGYPVPPRRWPLFSGYARLLAARGVVGAVVDVPYHDPADWQQVAERVHAVVESVRGLAEVDGERVALWAFSGGALLVGRWLADSPPWLRCLALTYPLLATADEGIMPADVVRPGRPVVLTRVGQESPGIQATVDRFLRAAAGSGTEVRVIDVPEGHHGFDCVDHTEESRRAVLDAAEWVVARVSD